MNLLSDIVQTRADRIDALQRGFTSAAEEREVANLILQTRDEALTELKLRLDHGPGHHDLLELLYHDIDDAGVREEIIEHIRIHSPAIPSERRRVRMISDIDDTLYASLNDPTYVRGTLYPGITTFHEEVGKLAFSRRSDIVDLILLTARPRDVLGLIESYTKSSSPGVWRLFALTTPWQLGSCRTLSFTRLSILSLILFLWAIAARATPRSGRCF